MKLRSRCSDPSSSQPVDEDDDLGTEWDSESSDEDFYENMIEEVEDSEDSGADVGNEGGNASDEDIGGSASRKRKVGPKKRKNCSNGKTGGQNVEEEVMVDRSNGHLPEITQLDGDYMECHKSKVSTKKKKKGKNEERPTLMWEVWEEELERWVDEHIAKEVDFENWNEVVSETANAPADLVMPLLRYQKEWLAWALKQEESVSRGGILADEMGMGKTVQAISLVLAKRELQKAIGEPYGLSTLPCSSKGLPGVKGTLVICPLVAVIQWVGEIEQFTAKGSNKVLVYHGANRGKTVQQFSEYDFVITTYSTVEAEYRKNVMPPKEKCQWCGKLLYDHKMAIHLKYFCGPDAEKTSKQSKQRKKRIKFSGKMSVQKAMVSEDDESESKGRKGRAGRKKKVMLDKAKKNVGIGSSSQNVAGTSIDTLVDKSILHSVKWERIILDEAHYIKDRRCNTTRAILTLESSYKWALSGTPLQNRVGELYSLVRFLHIVPYSYYFCKDCDCRTLDYSSSKDCPSCPHKAVRHFCWWNRYVATPIQHHSNSYSGRQAMFLLKHKLLKSIVLRRTKKGRAADLALPPRIVTLRKDTLDIKEEDYYTSLYNESQLQFNTYIKAGTVMNNYAHIFDLLTRLRQAVDHPYLVVCSNSAVNRRDTVANDTAGVGGEQTCGLCHDPAEDIVISSCTHIFCKSCLIDFSASVGQVSCPSCSKPLTVDFSTNANSVAQSTKTTIKGFRSSSILNRIQLDDFQTSTKIDALREEIRFMVERDGSAKGIVFSQFTSFLDLIHYSLQKSGINCVQLVGSMTMNARDAAITRFTDDPDCKIFLMSLKAGGVALNLTVASHVFLMDPWWNPAVERQAQDRIHRIGQYKPIRIVRFVIEDTIEERILKLQEKKELVFEGTVGGSSKALGKLTEADLKFLFVT